MVGTALHHELTPEPPPAESTVPPGAGRIHAIDLARGMACLSIPVFHGYYNLYVLDVLSTHPKQILFWLLWQRIGMIAFMFISGLSVALVARRGWSVRWWRRVGLLAVVAVIISLCTALVTERWIRFGIIHFFVVASLLAPLLVRLGWWNIPLGATILGIGFSTYRTGVWSSPWLYPFGLMADRPSTLDFIPLMPWLGVFMIGLALGRLLKRPQVATEPSAVSKPIIWLGRHSLWFYLLHQPVLFGCCWLIALALR